MGIGRAGNTPAWHIILVQASGTRGEVTVDHEVEVTADQNIVDVDAVGGIAIGLVVFKDDLDLAVGGRSEGITQGTPTFMHHMAFATDTLLIELNVA